VEPRGNYGNHTKGVFVSNHADHTFVYRQQERQETRDYSGSERPIDMNANLQVYAQARTLDRKWISFEFEHSTELMPSDTSPHALMEYNRALSKALGGETRMTRMSHVKRDKSKPGDKYSCSVHLLYVKEGDIGKVIMLEMTKGKALHLADIEPGKPPTLGYDAHESPDRSEFYVFDHRTMMDPPEPTFRAIPKFVIGWKAVPK
jgi:hypothetical protein